jgi:hypothetical protein
MNLNTKTGSDEMGKLYGVAVSLALVAGIAGGAAILSPIASSGAALAAPPRSASTALRPLSERDLTSSRQTGCTCSFDSRNSTFVQAIGNELMVRTAAGRQVCRITDAQFEKLSGGTGTTACGGVKLSLHRTGRSTSSPETDSSSAPTALTVVQGRTQGVLNGTFGCAC